MIVQGLQASYRHVENGMSRPDMVASRAVATHLDEVIIYRSTGPWSRRWIERKYPTKNFHVKGKSSDWGPQAGFVPYLGAFSKVGHNAAKAADGTAANDKGLHERYAAKVQLSLAPAELHVQWVQTEEKPPRVAVLQVLRDARDASSVVLLARRSGDGAFFTFSARMNSKTGRYDIFVDPTPGVHTLLPANLRGEPGARAGYAAGGGRLLAPQRLIPLEVMTSSEKGALNRPMTGDYDLMSICPRWESYGERSGSEISKEGLDFGRGSRPEAGLSFRAGTNMDAVLDMRTNTGAKGRLSADGKQLTFQGHAAKDMGKIRLQEHNDMGNLTPRILRAINALNQAMGAVGTDSPMRRVHHNAESHRNHIFGALQAKEMEADDGFPLTMFLPARLDGSGPFAGWGGVATLERMDEFRACAVALKAAGFFLPRNWAWGMSVRDQVASRDFRPGATAVY